MSLILALIIVMVVAGVGGTVIERIYAWIHRHLEEDRLKPPH